MASRNCVSEAVYTVQAFGSLRQAASSIERTNPDLARQVRNRLEDVKLDMKLQHPLDAHLKDHPTDGAAWLSLAALKAVQSDFTVQEATQSELKVSTARCLGEAISALQNQSSASADAAALWWNIGMLTENVFDKALPEGIMTPLECFNKALEHDPTLGVACICSGMQSPEGDEDRITSLLTGIPLACAARDVTPGWKWYVAVALEGIADQMRAAPTAKIEVDGIWYFPDQLLMASAQLYPARPEPWNKLSDWCQRRKSARAPPRSAFFDPRLSPSRPLLKEYTAIALDDLREQLCSTAVEPRWFLLPYSSNVDFYNSARVQAKLQKTANLLLAARGEVGREDGCFARAHDAVPLTDLSIIERGLEWLEGPIPPSNVESFRIAPPSLEGRNDAALPLYKTAVGDQRVQFEVYRGKKPSDLVFLQCLLEVDHPNIQRLEGFFERDSNTHVALECAPSTLQDFTQSLDVCIRYSMQLLGAVIDLHAAQYAHNSLNNGLLVAGADLKLGCFASVTAVSSPKDLEKDMADLLEILKKFRPTPTQHRTSKLHAWQTFQRDVAAISKLTAERAGELMRALDPVLLIKSQVANASNSRNLSASSAHKNEPDNDMQWELKRLRDERGCTTTLAFANCPSLTDDVLLHYLPLDHVKTVTITNCTSLTGVAVCSIRRNWVTATAITTLSLRGCSSVGDDLGKLLVHCRLLAVLDLTGTDVTASGSALLALSGLQRLREFYFKQYREDLDEVGLAGILPRIGNNLTKLGLMRCIPNLDTAIQECPKLGELQLAFKRRGRELQAELDSLSRIERLTLVWDGTDGNAMPAAQP